MTHTVTDPTRTGAFGGECRLATCLLTMGPGIANWHVCNTRRTLMGMGFIVDSTHATFVQILSSLPYVSQACPLYISSVPEPSFASDTTWFTQSIATTRGTLDLMPLAAGTVPGRLHPYSWQLALFLICSICCSWPLTLYPVQFTYQFWPQALLLVCSTSTTNLRHRVPFVHHMSLLATGTVSNMLHLAS